MAVVGCGGVWAVWAGPALRAHVPGPLPSSLWKLDLCTTILPQIEKLLKSKYERYTWGSSTCLTAGKRGDPGRDPRASDVAGQLCFPLPVGEARMTSSPCSCVYLARCYLFVTPSISLKLRPDGLHLPEADPEAVSAPDH